MAQLDLVVCPDSRRLLEAAADGFLDPPRATREEPFPSPPYLLALRQGGLRDDLIRLAAERGVQGWFDPPLCVFHELPDWLGKTGRMPLGDVERLVLLGAVLGEVAADVLARAHRVPAFLDAVDRLFGELVAEGVGAEAFDDAVHRRTGHPFELARDRELAAAYRAYLERLRAAGRRDGRDTHVDCAAALAADPDALAATLGGRREIRILGLLDLANGWRPLLAALGQSPALDRVALYVTDERILGEGLDARVTHLDPSIPEALDRTDPRSFALISAPEAEREVEEVAVRVRRLADEGVPLDRIAVVSRKARPYVDLAVDALTRVGVPAAARRRHGFDRIPVVRSVLSLFRAAADGWTRRGLVGLAGQPYFAGELDTLIVNHLGMRRAIAGLDAWLDAARALETEAAAAEARDDDDAERRRRSLPPAERVRAARAGLEHFAERARVLDGTRTLAEWVAWLARFLEDDPWGIERAVCAVPDGRLDIARLDMAGWRAIRRAVREWCDALEAWGSDATPTDAAGFHEALVEVLSGDAALWTPWHRGVRVLEALAAAYRPVDHLFIVGLDAGAFPTVRPRSPILDEADRAAFGALGLPLDSAAVWDAREERLFTTLLGGAAGSVTLSYVAFDDLGQAAAPSAFVEAVAASHTVERREIPLGRVHTPGFPVYEAAGVLEHARHAAAVERERATGRPGRFHGVIEDPALVGWLGERYGDGFLWSPTQLEEYAKCPWAWFTARILGLEMLEDPDQEMDPATRGGILHDALERFYADARARTGGPVFLHDADRSWVPQAAEAALDAALADARLRQWVGHPSLLPAKRAELLRILAGYLEWEIRLHEDMYAPKKRTAPAMVRTAVEEHEVGFSDAVLERGGVRFRYRGRIDRVERGCDERVDAARLIAAVDYKTTTSSTPGGGKKAAWDDGIVLQIPLYAHALATLRPDDEVVRVEYRALRTPGEAHRLQFRTVDRKAGALVENGADREKYEAALDAVPRHVLAVRAGLFPPEPPPSCNCPKWCHGSDMCRIPGGPRFPKW